MVARFHSVLVCLLVSFLLFPTPVRGGGQFPSDCNQDGSLDLSDALCFLSFFFLGTQPELPCGNGTSADPANFELLNANGDGGLDLADAVFVLGFLFLGTAPPALCEEGVCDCVFIAGCPEVCSASGPPGAMFVANSITVPASAAEAAELGLNIDGDAGGRPDNAFGAILASLAGTAGIGFQAAVDDLLRAGGIINLFAVQTDSFTDATSVSFRSFIGTDALPTPCVDELDEICGRHLDGDGSFTVDPGAPTGSEALGDIVGGGLSAGPGELSIQFSTIIDSTAIVLPLVGARVVIDDITANGWTSGRLGGAVRAEDIATTILPSMHALITGIIAEDCPGGSCQKGSTGEVVLKLFDANEDGAVTLDEFANSSLVQALLAPDVDLFDGTGAFNPGIDGVKDALSIGFGFSAVPASFELPDGA